jgi:phospholipid/cholesterol/gamma-HCH transport system substrate-binding protein
MNGKRLETRVGLFVLVGLVLLAVLLLLFSKGMTLTRDVFYVQLRSTRVGGIRPGANVLLAGVPIGRVADVTLDADGKAVTMRLKISTRYRIYRDARFEVEQAGFLGDQYISIYPGDNVGEPLTNNAVVYCQPPFNVQEALAQAVETISRIGQATTNVNAAVADVRRHLLNEQRLTRLGGAIDRFALLTADAQTAVSNVNALIAANALPVTRAVSNLNHFSTQLGELGTNVNAWFEANDERLTALLQNLERASVALTNLLEGLEAGRGAAGRLLRDEQLAAQLSAIAENLAVTTSNLNRRGLWGILWAPKPARTNPPPETRLSAPRDPFR